MAGSSFGTIFRITTWGESHGEGLGAVVDGCPAGIPLTEGYVQRFLDRRKPGKSKYATKRTEPDRVQILSGVFEGKTTGTPVSMMVKNEDQRSRDYSEIASCYRPGHADYTFDAKYGFRDYRGGGRSSGRETVGRVAGGAVAEAMLSEIGIGFLTYVKSIGPVTCSQERFDREEISRNALCMPDAEAAKEAQSYLDACMEEKNSAGGVIECMITGVPAGIGDPVFEKLDANLAKAVFSIGAVKGFEIGSGFDAAKSDGRTNNDAFCLGEDGKIAKETNHAGGILGGISDGSPIVFRAAVKPTPSIASPQRTVRTDGTPVTVEIRGRHDPVIAPRAAVVVEAMAALTIADAVLLNMSARQKNIRDFYKNS